MSVIAAVFFHMNPLSASYRDGPAPNPVLIRLNDLMERSLRISGDPNFPAAYRIRVTTRPPDET